MDNDIYLFFCQHCGLPQRMKRHDIMSHLMSPFIDGFLCENCDDYNAVTRADKQAIVKMMAGK